MLDPAIAAKAILMEAEYLRLQAIVAAKVTDPKNITRMDLSPMGR